MDTASTLPLWKNRKNVTITYQPKEGGNPASGFLDIVEFNNAKSDPDKPPSKVVGVDENETPAALESSDSRLEENAAKFKWRGKGLLAISSSKWQILGYFLAEDPARKDEDWVVTYFGKTLVRAETVPEGEFGLSSCIWSRCFSSPRPG